MTVQAEFRLTTLDGGISREVYEHLQADLAGLGIHARIADTPIEQRFGLPEQQVVDVGLCLMGHVTSRVLEEAELAIRRHFSKRKRFAGPTRTLPIFGPRGEVLSRVTAKRRSLVPT